ncbi:mis18-binding protein 1-like isoform X2 [Festucalex cinctus]
MTSYQRDLQCSDTWLQSPAKVFALLKSRVQSGDQMTCGVREEHAAQVKGAVFCRTDNIWDDELHHTFGEFEACTFSPFKSPKKSLGDSYSDYNGEEAELPLTNGCKSPMRHLMDSTLFFPPRIRPRSTGDPQQMVDKSVARLEEQISTVDAPLPPVSSFSPVRKKLRKRKADTQDINNVCSSAKITLDREDVNMETAVGSSYTPEKNTNRMKRCAVSSEKLMSPAKIFVQMKERVSRRELEQDSEDCPQLSERMDGAGYGCHSKVDKMEECNVLRRGPEVEIPVTQELADSQSDTLSPKEDSSAAIASKHILFDPIFFYQPTISIPKYDNSKFKNKQLPNFTKAPSESAIKLQEWFLRRNRNGLFVEGTLMDNRTQWNSNIIVERVSHTMLKTLSGNIYILVGKMKPNEQSDFPRWFLRKFTRGFPAHWKELFEKCLSELEGKEKVRTEKRSKITRTTTETSALPRVKKNKENAVNTTHSICTSAAQTTRSGRLIKPPLDYWKGGRVVLDADMNVTVFDGYNTSRINTEDSTSESMEKSKKTDQAFLLNGKDHKQRKSTRDTVQPAPPTKAKTRRKPRVEIQHEEPTSVSIKTEVKTRRHHTTIGSDENLNIENAPPPSKPKKLPLEGSKPKVRNTRQVRSRGKITTAQSVPVNDKLSESEDLQQQEKNQRRANHTDAHESTKAKSSQRKAKTLPVQESKKEVLNAPPLKRSARTVGAKLLETSSLEEKELVLSTKRKKRCTRMPRQQSQKPQTKSLEPLSPAKASTKLTQSKKKTGRGRTVVTPLGQDEDEWTQNELAKLQQAVSEYPLHMAFYWEKVARMVGTRSAEECRSKELDLGDCHTPVKRTQGKRKKKVEPPKATDNPIISGGINTLKRRQTVRQFLQTMPKENTNDAFTASQNKCFEIPGLYLDEDQDFQINTLEPVTPVSLHFPKVKTPRCLHTTPGMVHSPNRNLEDKYAFQLQKAITQNQAKNRKKVPAKKVLPTPPPKQKMRRLEDTANDSFVVWEMFPDKDATLSDSGEEEDFYFSSDE